jgi:CTP:molybdopterin cytidylyltransferase MocA
MGANKAMLDAGGRTFIERVVRAHAEAGCDPVVVVVRPDPGPEAAAARAAGATVLSNPDPGEGPISSVRLALERIGDVAGCALCPVDHPLVQASTIRELADVFHGGVEPLVIPTFEGTRGHPVLVRGRLFEELREPDLEEGARTVVHRHLGDARFVEVEDPGVTADIDTLSDYRHHFPEGYRTRFQSR